MNDRAAAPSNHLFSAPHRPAFFIGAAQLLLVMLFWLAELTGRAGVLLTAPLALSIPAPWAHSLLMVYTLFTCFIYGFLFTVFPRWLGTAPIGRPYYVGALALAATGIVCIYLGLVTHAIVLAVGVGLFLLSWLLAIGVLIDVYRASDRHGWYERLLLLELCIGVVGLALFLYGVLAMDARYIPIARDTGLWGFLVPVVLTVAHRVIPFFTQSALPFGEVPRPAWSLPLFVVGSFLHGALELAGLPLARVPIDLTLALIVFHHSWQWGLTRGFRIRLLAMLHVGFLWFGAAMLLYALDAVLVLTQTGTLGRAPLHALGIGFLTGTLIAMTTRVTLGHSGHPLVPDFWTWRWFVGLNLVVLLRIAAELAIAPTMFLTLNLLAAAGWLVCLAPWVLRYAPIYWRPRADQVKVPMPQPDRKQR